MPRSFDTTDYTVTKADSYNPAEHPNKVSRFYDDKKDYRKRLTKLQEAINERQRMMYAHDRYSMLLIFQALDAAGKDGTIRAIMSGVNAHGIAVHGFKKPSSEELDHDFLWRTTRRLPQRGKIGIFNRSYYEEVLVAKVHPQIVLELQRLPRECTNDSNQLWQHRYESIRDFEKHCHRNGTRVLKFYLHLSRDEQRARFLDRIDEPDKNWKFSEADIAERKYWDDYQLAYREAINATASEYAPWYVIPADDKKNMRLIVAQIVLEQLNSLDMQYPEVSDERRNELQRYREMLEND